MGASFLRRPFCSRCRPFIFQFRLQRSYSLPSTGQRLVQQSHLPRGPVRTRFAPSPTGYLHLGSLRTALYNYLLARATKGQFLLRLEDTDQTRIVPDAERRLYEDLKWSGLSWDEGPDRGGQYGPYRQSERSGVYHEHAQLLLHRGKAFRCFCSQEEKESSSSASAKCGSGQGRHPSPCLDISPGDSAQRAAEGAIHTIRFRSNPTPVDYYDTIYGQCRKKMPEDDFVIIKSDGYPTYHFASVVDDHLMSITHVIRGAEWLTSTPKHVDLYRAFGWEPPAFAHVGLLVDANRQKLSKRNHGVGIATYRRDHVPPAALLNFSALLGWNPRNGPGNGIMTLSEMVQNFTLDLARGDVVVNLDRLDFFRKKHCRRLLLEDPPDMASINEYLVEPVLRRAREIEARRQHNLIGGSLAGLDPLTAGLGTLVPQMGNVEGEAAREHVYNAMRISRNPTLTPDAILDTAKFLIWRPSVQHISSTFGAMRDSTTKALVVEETTSPPTAILARLLDALSQPNEDSWAPGTLETALAEVGNGIRPLGVLRPGSAGTAYHILRWAIMGSDAGPAIVPLLCFLGKEETLLRLRTALSATERPFAPLTEEGIE